jgi:hypothetical protein
MCRLRCPCIARAVPPASMSLPVSGLTCMFLVTPRIYNKFKVPVMYSTTIPESLL